MGQQVHWRAPSRRAASETRSLIHSGEVWDPIGTAITNYRAVADQIQGVLEIDYDRMAELAGESQEADG